MKKSLQMGSAFIGVIVGAGFASGQEILQYFTSFGLMGIMGAVVATALFAYLGMNLVRLGSRMQKETHKDAIYGISGKYIGRIVDYIIIFTLFGVGVVMIAGAGSLFSQQFGLPAFLGSTLLTLLVLGTIMLNVQRVVAIIGGITPVLILAVVLVCVYSLLTATSSFAELNPIAMAQPTTLPNWFISAVNYVSFNIAVGASMAIVMGASEKDEKIAARGGLFGGLGIGILILLSHLAIFSKVDSVAGYEMPMLAIIDHISPALGVLMSFVLFGMIFNTAVGMFYSFSARFVEMGTAKSRVFITITCLTGYIASFIGFTGLVSLFYPLIGYLGLFLVGAVIYSSFRKPPESTAEVSAAVRTE